MKTATTIVFFLAVVAVVFLQPNSAEAFLFKPFGGPIKKITACAEPVAGLLLEIGPPREGNFLLLPTTVIYPFRIIRPGAQTLGLAGPKLLGCYEEVTFRRRESIFRLLGEGAPILFMGTSL